MIEDPFAPPASEVEARSVPLHRDEAAVALRKEHLATEEKLKRGGAWLVITGATMIFLGALAIVFSIARDTESYYWAILLVPSGAAYAAGGAAIIALVPGSNVPASLLAYMLFFVFPIGTAIASYVSHVCMKAIGSPVLTREYRVAIDATPDLRTSAWTPVTAGGTALLFAASIAAAFAWF